MITALRDGIEDPIASLVMSHMWNKIRDLPEVQACILAPLLTGERPTIEQEVAMNRAIVRVVETMTERKEVKP